jgi:hypothetical protein
MSSQLQIAKERLMEWFGIKEVGVLLLSAWIFLSIGLLPKMIDSPTALIMIVLIVGCAIFWGSFVLAPRSPFYIIYANIVLIVAALLAVLNSEVIFRRRNGYWRFVGKRTDGDKNNAAGL